MLWVEFSAGFCLFRWVHVVCMLYTPNIEYMEPNLLSGVTLDQFPSTRWGSKSCQLCEDSRMSRTGICIGCDAGLCKSSFHVTWWDSFPLALWPTIPSCIFYLVPSSMAYCVRWTVMRKTRVRNYVTLSLHTARPMQTRILPRERWERSFMTGLVSTFKHCHSEEIISLSSGSTGVSSLMNQMREWVLEKFKWEYLRWCCIRFSII